MKKPVFLQTILIIILSISVFGASVTTDFDEWRYPEENLYNTNTLLNVPERGHFDSETYVLDSNGAGTSSFYPIISGFNASSLASEKKIVLVEGSSIVIYDEDLTFLDEYVSTEAPSENPIIKYYQNETYIIFPNSTHIIALTYNETSSRLEEAYSSATSNTVGTSFKCLENEENENLNDWCMAYSENVEQVIFFDLDDGSIFNKSTGLSLSGETINNNPLLYDIDRDGYENFIVTYTLASGFSVYVYNFEINRVMGTYDYETSFGTNGNELIRSGTPTYADSGVISSPKLIQADSGGNYEIMFAWAYRGNDAYGGVNREYLYLIKSNGDIYDSFYTSVSGDQTHNIYNLDSEACYFDTLTPTPCLSFSGFFTDTGSVGRTKCYHENGSTILSLNYGGNLKCRDMDYDNIEDLIINQEKYSSEDENYIIILDNNLEEESRINLSSDNYENIVINDLEGDLEVEIIESGTDGTKIWKSTWTNELPEWDYLTNGGIYGYYSTACLDTTNTFYVIENLADSEDYSYTNDLGTDIEQLCLEYANGTVDCGSGSTNNPYYSIYHDTTGFFTYTFVMTDNSNSGSYTEEKELTILVIDGDEGETCNVASNLVTSPSQGGEEVSSSSQTQTELTQELFQGDDFAMLIVGLVLIVGMAISGAKVGGGLGLLFGGIFGAFVGVVLGWISAWILVMTLMIVFAIAIIKGVVFGKNSGGE